MHRIWGLGFRGQGFGFRCTATILLVNEYTSEYRRSSVLMRKELFYQCITSVLLVYYYCITSVLLVYYQRITSVLLLRRPALKSQCPSTCILLLISTTVLLLRTPALGTQRGVESSNPIQSILILSNLRNEGLRDPGELIHGSDQIDQIRLDWIDYLPTEGRCVFQIRQIRYLPSIDQIRLDQIRLITCLQYAKMG